ncbi:hypothetical protein [Aliikangiella sp. IMCC44359]|uniref:hypothetical protein n=1 Tax=Aliikangiella sp. IMCC44359 TaxID=3459125 RepID=UPI00403AE426
MTFQLNCGTPLSEQGDHLSSHFTVNHLHTQQPITDSHFTANHLHTQRLIAA